MNQGSKEKLLYRECIILAGGLGTRLRDVVPGLPKCLAPVAGKPFLAYVINSLRMQGVQKFIFSLGFMSEAVLEYIDKDYPTLQYDYVIETTPLGTGGAIHLALSKATTENVVITNGDTLYKVNLDEAFHLHLDKNAAATLLLKPMQDFDRYGVVEVDPENKIQSFQEKKYYTAGHINGGMYILNKHSFLERTGPGKFSFEKDFLEAHYNEGIFCGLIQDGYFIDIGIPEDFARAGKDLEKKPLDLSSIDRSWTLFLDRDGVINEEKLGHYILHWNEFIFSKGVLDVFKKLNERFGKIIVVSNQRGVGKGLMDEAALQSIHLEMQREVEIVGAGIEKIYYCTDTQDTSFFRKPNPGMAFLALKDFTDIDPARCVMVGNKPGDMKFGRAAGFHTVFVTTTNPEQEFPHPDIDAHFPSLPAFAQTL
ncbi:MAG: HAD-IIIA family hydrolase [Flavisolibacter sp.]|jgi:D-glycero-alpha-D-manno-heptose 1-phosphate guanylyltransferase|nr:HAD-IIIA family hydrolase [Flavisolibacter sp.]